MQWLFRFLSVSYQHFLYADRLSSIGAITYHTKPIKSQLAWPLIARRIRNSLVERRAALYTRLKLQPLVPGNSPVHKPTGKMIWKRNKNKSLLEAMGCAILCTRQDLEFILLHTKKFFDFKLNSAFGIEIFILSSPDSIDTYILPPRSFEFSVTIMEPIQTITNTWETQDRHRSHQTTSLEVLLPWMCKESTDLRKMHRNEIAIFLEQIVHAHKNQLRTP